MSKENTDGGAMVKMVLSKKGGITHLEDCSYSLVWTSRPVLSKKKNYELFPASFINQLIQDEEFKPFSKFLDNTRSLFGKHNIGIKEYIFE